MAFSSNIPKDEEKRLAIEKIENAFAKINSEVISIFDNDTLPTFLAFAAKFHYFDINNIILIYKRRPTATFIAPFKTWQRISEIYWRETGRRILLKSEEGQGIGVLVPYILRKKISDAPNLRSATVATRVVPYFDYHVVYLYDKDQTVGIPAPALEWNLSTNKLDAEAAFHAFKTLSPFNILFSTDEYFKGDFIFEEGNQSTGRPDTLVLNPRHKNNFFVLCGLILRTFVVKQIEIKGSNYSPNEFEKIVECVSFVLASYLGLSTNHYTFFFAKSWATNSQQMLGTLSTIRQFSHMLIDDIEVEMIDYKSQFGNTEDIFAANEEILEFESMSLFDIDFSS